MMIILSGGTGTPKLINGLRELIPDDDISVIVNTGEDFWESGVLVTPDIDTVLYLFSGDLDTSRWWGVRNETWQTYEHLKALGHEELLPLSDFDRAANLLRRALLDEGKTLTAATAVLAERLGVKAAVLPMTDAPVETTITIKEPFGTVSDIHYQEFWVGKRGAPDVVDVKRKGIDAASPTPEVRALLEDPEEKVVLIGPSNPITSIGPILEVPGLRDLLKKKKVIAVSPIIGDEPVSGPAGKLMTACGLDVSSASVAALYKDIADVFICDVRDEKMTPEAAETLLADGIRVERFDTMMTDIEKSKALARFILDLAEELP